MTRSGIAFRPQTLEPLTLDEESGLWPTPQKHDATGGRGKNNMFADNHYYPHDVADEVKFPTPRVCAGLRSSGMNRTEMYRAFWPTPRSEDSQCAGNHPGAVDSLHVAAKLWPTPCAADGKDTASGDLYARVNGVGRQRWATPAKRDARSGKGRQPNGHTPQLAEQTGGQLNPTWVEWLMGYPSEWTVLRRSVMPSSRNASKK